MSVFQNILHQRMQRLMQVAVSPPDKVVDEGNGRRPDKRRHYHEIFKDICGGQPVGRHPAPQFSEQEAGCGRFDIEAADCVAAPDQILGGAI
jgi:hypothetical protein